MGAQDVQSKPSLTGQISIDYGNGQILFYPSGSTVPNVMAGNYYAPSGESSGAGFKVAKDGFDVRTASNSNLIFDSSQDFFQGEFQGIYQGLYENSFNVALTDTYSVTLGAGSYTNGQLIQHTVAHGQSFIPAFLLYVNHPAVTSVGNGLQLSPSCTYAAFSALPGGGTIYLPTILSFGTIDSTNLNINIQFLTNYSLGSSYTWNYRYYILKEGAT